MTKAELIEEMRLYEDDLDVFISYNKQQQDIEQVYSRYDHDGKRVAIVISGD